MTCGVHKKLDERCPYCGLPMIEVITTGFKFCSNPNTLDGCDYEVEPIPEAPHQ